MDIHLRPIYRTINMCMRTGKIAVVDAVEMDRQLFALTIFTRTMRFA